MDKVLGYSCICQEGFTGELCNIEINECEGMEQACHNGGTCIDKIGEKFLDIQYLGEKFRDTKADIVGR
jgi:hypothetical protein